MSGQVTEAAPADARISLKMPDATAAHLRAAGAIVLPIIAVPAVAGWLTVLLLACIPLFLSSLIACIVFVFTAVPAAVVWAVVFGRAHVKSALDMRRMLALLDAVRAAPVDAFACTAAVAASAALMLTGLVLALFLLTPATCCASAGVGVGVLLFLPLSYGCCLVVCAILLREVAAVAPLLPLRLQKGGPALPPRAG
eukprot:TRINITY_DN284_c0_g3_i1.p2 TRINITY_DN284_c0_g3~~TRINITY_DN284_c0_g3_i1.p2  ORF type:complete len:197 (+),score=46.61 TRINITY_DN284_c0_g3_i1:95-685(+)